MNKCRTCQFWQPHPNPVMTDDGFGVCHRYPPTVPYNDEDPDHAGQEFTRYPTTNEEDWCGEQRQSADPKRYT